MDAEISWNEAEGNPLADRNPYVGPQAVADSVFARLLAAATASPPFLDVHRRRRPRRGASAATAAR
jgi:hypothetical protein